MRLAPEINEFFIEGGRDDISHALLHITEPSTPEEERKGYFFALAEIEHGSTETVQHLQKMIDDLESGYYASEEKDKDPFEATLEYLNRRGHHILLDERAKVHCFVGVIRGPDIVFAYHGSPRVGILYQGKENLEYISILDESPDLEKSQLFSSLLQGSINPGDILIVATPRVHEHFTPDRMKKLLVSRGVKETVEHIGRVLRDIRNDYSFAGLFLTLPDKRLPPAPGKKPSEAASSVDSVALLAHAEKATDEILSPSLFADAGKKIHSLLCQENKRPADEKNPNGETNYRPRTNTNAQNLAATMLIGLGKALVIGFLGIFHIARATIFWLFNLIINIFYLATNYRRKRHDVIAQWKRNWHHRRVSFHALPFLSKALLVGAITAGVILSVSVVYFRWKEKMEMKAANYAALIKSIESRAEEAEGGLIYGNSEQAFTLLREASDLVKKLPEESLAEKETRGRLAADIDNSFRKIRKFVSISPVVFFRLSDIRPEADGERLVLLGDTIMAYGANDTHLYAIDIATEKGKAIDHATIPALHAATAPKEKDRAVFLSGEDRAAEFDVKSGALLSKSISFPVAGVKLADAFVYNQRLYAIDPAQKNIYRHSRTQTGYDQGIIWQKNGNEELGTARSLAIDGDVYVLTSNSVLKYQNGFRQGFVISGLDPILDEPSAIWTYSDVNNIYILEPKNRRVIVLSKEGKLMAQYTSPDWKNPTGMAVLENKKTIYILDSNVIYQFSI